MIRRSFKTERRKELAFVGFMLGFLCFAVLVAEAAIRMETGYASRYIMGFKPEKNLRPADFWKTVGYRQEGISTYRMKSGTSLGHVQINDLGLRGPQVETPKPDNRVRIAVLGASTVVGVALKEHETLPAKIVQRLGSNNPKCSFDYISVSGPGYQLSDHAWLMRNELAEEEIDHFVIVQSNTLRRNVQVTPKNADFPSLTAVFEKSLFFQKVRTIVNSNSVQASDDLVERQHAALQEIVRIAGNRPIWYNEFHSGRRTARSEVPTLWTNVVRDELKNLHGARYSDALKEIPPTPSYFFLSAGHYTPRGAALSAQIIAEEILDQFPEPNGLCRS